MGMWTAIQGWLQLDQGQRNEAAGIVEEHAAQTGEGRGWLFAPPSHSIYLLYAYDVRDQAVANVLAVVERLASIAPSGLDPDRVEGYFLLSDERQQSRLWTVRHGAVEIADAPEELRWLARRP